MPSPIPIPVRRCIYRRWKKGHSASQIASELGLSDRTTRNLIKRFAEQGEQGIETAYRRDGSRMSSQQKQLRLQAEQLRREHPRWGTELIRIKLKAIAGETKLPCSRTIRNWFSDSKLSLQSQPNRPKAVNKPSAGLPHQTWQLDASEEIRLATGELICWVRLVDEYTGAFLKTRVFPPGKIQSCGPSGSQNVSSGCLRAMGYADGDSS